eukprot:gnl/MRDRNA2_/MRDRNA2_69121_c0_seq1.p1 gnl/MRDRNA2_/MRDRNA2_69121_c0~~gnl/MRDRNA2_/MRDRNA2_69121_c0_seq1.p1  ORF type:complete len:169 (+),score=21.34 gnl/MRDRNA2_/MRDRNA2_69121_c0_seq1:45-551(+)
MELQVGTCKQPPIVSFGMSLQSAWECLDASTSMPLESGEEERCLVPTSAPSVPALPVMPRKYVMPAIPVCNELPWTCASSCQNECCETKDLGGSTQPVVNASTSETEANTLALEYGIIIEEQDEHSHQDLEDGDKPRLAMHNSMNVTVSMKVVSCKQMGLEPNEVFAH